MKYSEVRNNYRGGTYFWCDSYAQLLSPLTTSILLKLKLIPNIVTLLMIISGVIGGILFSFNNNLIKFVGIVFIHLWYVLDCSDGEIARITKIFSKMGKEIDFTAHIVNHPIFLLSFAISLLSLDNTTNRELILICLFLLSSLELINRNLLSFSEIYSLKVVKNSESVNDENKAKQNRSKIKKFIIHIVTNITILPNFVLLFPLIYMADVFLGTTLSLYYFFLKTIIMIVMVMYFTIAWIKKILFI